MGKAGSGEISQPLRMIRASSQKLLLLELETIYQRALLAWCLSGLVGKQSSWILALMRQLLPRSRI